MCGRKCRHLQIQITRNSDEFLLSVFLLSVFYERRGNAGRLGWFCVGEMPAFFVVCVCVGGNAGILTINE